MLLGRLAIMLLLLSCTRQVSDKCSVCSKHNR